LETKIKIFKVILFLIPIVIFFTFNYLDIPKKIFIGTIFFFNDYNILSVFLFILFYIIAILSFLPLGVFFHIISGIIFGSLFGYLLSISAILAATTISFYVSHNYVLHKNFSSLINKKKIKYRHYLKKFKFSNNEILNIFLLRITFFIPISIQNILIAFVTKNLVKLLFVTVITTSPPMLVIIISASKIRDNLNYDQFQTIELTKIYITIFLLLTVIHLMRLLINSLISKNKNQQNMSRKI
jgi:uncharacterized membrane protein YdjX (TVP38/TMEM64 family)